MDLRKKITTTLKEAIAVNNRPFPWERAIGAGISMALPIFMGIWLDQLQYGLIAGLGGFTYLYAFSLPYAHLSKRLLFVGVSIILSAFLGSLLSPYPLMVAIVMGLISGIMLFIFNALKFVGPSSIFFVLIFALTADMPETDFAGALFRASLVTLGAILSWFIAMSGFLINPHRPEIKIIQRAYQQLTKLTESVGTEQFSDQKYRTMSLFKETIDTLIAGELPWKPSATYKRLLHLAIEGNEYFLYLMNHYGDAKTPLPKECTEYLTSVETALKIRLKDKNRIIEPREVPALKDKA